MDRDIETGLFCKIERKAFGAGESDADINISHFNREVLIFGIFAFMLIGQGVCCIAAIAQLIHAKNEEQKHFFAVFVNYCRM